MVPRRIFGCKAHFSAVDRGIETASVGARPASNPRATVPTVAAMWALPTGARRRLLSAADRRLRDRRQLVRLRRCRDRQQRAPLRSPPGCLCAADDGAARHDADEMGTVFGTRMDV